MMYYIVGLGNPGAEYEKSRHSAGRIVALDFAKKMADGEPEFDKKLNALAVEGKIGEEKFQVLVPETFMNKSGQSIKSLVGKLVKKKKAVIKGKKKDVLVADNLIVLHDDLDIGLGNFKISYGKSAGGHKGVGSVAAAVKTLDFIRIRIGVSPMSQPRFHPARRGKTGQAGKVKRPSSDDIIDFIIGKFKPAELETLKKVSKKISEAIEVILNEGVSKAMSEFN